MGIEKSKNTTYYNSNTNFSVVQVKQFLRSTNPRMPKSGSCHTVHSFFQVALHDDSLGINVLRLYSKEWKVCTRSRIKTLAMNN